MKRKILYVIMAGIIAIISVGAYSYYAESTTVPVLNYHKVQDGAGTPLAVGTKEFEEQMAYLHEKGFTAITPDQLVDYVQAGKPLPAKPVLITFDDGYRDFYFNAYPILKKYGLTATVFVITDVIGHDPGYLDWDQIIEMRDHGKGIVFGSHTLSHAALNTIPPGEIMFQLVKSKEGMEWKLDAPVKYFAYPGGAYDRNIEKLVQQAGYKAAFAIDLGRVDRRSDLFALERIPIYQTQRTFANFYIRLHFTSVAAGVKAVRDLVLAERNKYMD